MVWVGKFLFGVIFGSRSTSDNPLLFFQDGIFWDPQYPLAVIPGFSGVSKNPLLLLQNFLGSLINPCCYSRMGIFPLFQNGTFLGSLISSCCYSRIFWISKNPLLLLRDGIFWDLQYRDFPGSRMSWKGSCFPLPSWGN